MKTVAPFTIALVVTIVIVQDAPEAFSCSCSGPQPPNEAYSNSVAVFIGKVVSITSGDYARTVQFDAEMAWKGVSENQVVLTTGGSGASCGYDFEEGREYLVYAYGNPESLEAGLCGRTRPVLEAYTDLTYLGPGYVPVPGEPIVERTPDGSFLPFIGIGAIVAGVIAFIVLRKTRD